MIRSVAPFPSVTMNSFFPYLVRKFTALFMVTTGISLCQIPGAILAGSLDSDALELVYEYIQKEADPEKKEELYRDYLGRSGKYLEKNPNAFKIWVRRGEAALGVRDTKVSQEVLSWMKTAGAEASATHGFDKVMMALQTRLQDESHEERTMPESKLTLPEPAELEALQGPKPPHESDAIDEEVPLDIPVQDPVGPDIPVEKMPKDKPDVSDLVKMLSFDENKKGKDIPDARPEIPHTMVEPGGATEETGRSNPKKPVTFYRGLTNFLHKHREHPNLYLKEDIPGDMLKKVMRRLKKNKAYQNQTILAIIREKPGSLTGQKFPEDPLVLCSPIGHRQGRKNIFWSDWDGWLNERFGATTYREFAKLSELEIQMDGPLKKVALGGSHPWGINSQMYIMPLLKELHSFAKEELAAISEHYCNPGLWQIGSRVITESNKGVKKGFVKGITTTGEKAELIQLETSPGAIVNLEAASIEYMEILEKP